jgi:chemotaxis protein CheY-P-specific phosphatase CheC
MKSTDEVSLNKNQIESFDRFLVTATRDALDYLESMFLLNIDSSSADINIEPAVNNEKIHQLGESPLYAISSSMTGELQGNLHLLMRTDDFQSMGEVMKPILKLVFLSSPDANLADLECQMPDWMQDDENPSVEDMTFHEQLMDTLTEIGNLLFGVYSRAFYKIYDLHTSLSSPQALKNPDQQPINKILSTPEPPDQWHLLIENEFVVLNKSIRFWSLISVTQKSFNEILDRIK